MAEPNALTPFDTAKLLRTALDGLRAELGAVPAAALGWHPAPGEWCIKEVLGHLIETEQRGFAGRVKIILASANPKLATWDQEEVARSRLDCERDVTALVGEFSNLRESSIAQVRGLKEADLERGGDHVTVGFLRVRDLLHEWVYHDRNHVKQILANVQAFVWPHMGNTRRFSES